MASGGPRSVVVGVDVGGSKTFAAVAGLDGSILGWGRGPGGNRQLVGASGFRRAVDTAVQAALAAAGRQAGDVLATHVGAAGVDFPEDRAELAAVLPRATIENDTLLGLAAGTAQGWGGAVVAGSGTNAVARTPDGRVLFVGGVSWATGDCGGAWHLGVEALRLAIRSWEEREPPTVLVDRLCDTFGFTGMDALFHAVGTGTGPDPMAVAPLAVAAAAGGDAPCAALVGRFGHEYGLAVGTALRRVGLAGASPETVALGGLVRMAAGGVLLDALRDALLEQAPTAVLRVLDTEPVVGAVVSALRTAGADAPGLAARVRQEWEAARR